MKQGNLVEIFDLTSVFNAPWQKIGLVLGKSAIQKTEGYSEYWPDCDTVFWDVLLNGKQYRLPNYRLRRIE